MQSTLNIICLDTPAFQALLDEVVQRINITHSLPEKKWILSEDAMELLGISSRTTLQKLREEGKLRFSCPGGKIYFYDRESIDEYITSKAIDTY